MNKIVNIAELGGELLSTRSARTSAYSIDEVGNNYVICFKDNKIELPKNNIPKDLKDEGGQQEIFVRLGIWSFGVSQNKSFADSLKAFNSGKGVQIESGMKKYPYNKFCRQQGLNIRKAFVNYIQIKK